MEGVWQEVKAAGVKLFPHQGKKCLASGSPWVQAPARALTCWVTSDTTIKDPPTSCLPQPEGMELGWRNMLS